MEETTWQPSGPAARRGHLWGKWDLLHGVDLDLLDRELDLVFIAANWRAG